jgi:hypothetical protein
MPSKLIMDESFLLLLCWMDDYTRECPKKNDLHSLSAFYVPEI